MNPRDFALRTILVSLVLSVGAGSVVENVLAGPRETMAEAMVRMMEAMGMLEPSAMASMGSPFGPSSWFPGAGGFGTPDMSPWAGPITHPSGALEQGGQAFQRFSNGMGTQMFPWAPGSPLEGVWEGRNGELLIVQGNRFRLYPGSAGYLDGFLQLKGDRLAMYNPEDANIRPFEYAESQGRLVLRGEGGAMYLYKRLWLDEHQDFPVPTPQPQNSQK